MNSGISGDISIGLTLHKTTVFHLENGGFLLLSITFFTGLYFADMGVPQILTRTGHGRGKTAPVPLFFSPVFCFSFLVFR